MLEQLQILSSRSAQLQSDTSLRTSIAMALRAKHSLPKSIREWKTTSPSMISTNRFTPENHNEFSNVIYKVTRQVKQLETEFSNIDIPDHQLNLLRDLHVRVDELNRVTLAELDTREADKEVLKHDLKACQNRIDEMMTQHSISIDSMRKRYEAAMSDLQDAMDEQTEVAKANTNRLEDVIQQTQAQNLGLKGKIDRLETGKKEQPQLAGTLLSLTFLLSDLTN